MTPTTTTTTTTASTTSTSRKPKKAARPQGANVEVCLSSGPSQRAQSVSVPSSPSSPPPSPPSSEVAAVVPSTNLIGEAKARVRARLLRFCGAKARTYKEIAEHSRVTDAQTRYVLRGLVSLGEITKSGHRENTTYATVSGS